jgi:hypothetical protein
MHFSYQGWVAARSPRGRAKDVLGGLDNPARRRAQDRWTCHAIATKPVRTLFVGPAKMP